MRAADSVGMERDGSERPRWDRSRGVLQEMGGFVLGVAGRTRVSSNWPPELLCYRRSRSAAGSDYFGTRPRRLSTLITIAETRAAGVQEVSLLHHRDSDMTMTSAGRERPSL